MPDTREQATDYQGHYAGPLVRLLAYALDLGVINVVFAASLAIVQFAINTCTPWTVNFQKEYGWMIAVYLLWAAVYFLASWAGFARSPGMGILGIRIVRADGGALEPRRALVRLIAFPLGFLTLGAGFLGIIFGRRHQAIYDRIARTSVIFHWDAEATKLRHLAEQGRMRRRARAARTAG